MALRISGPGVGLPPPQALYPLDLSNTPFTAPCSKILLQAAQTVTIPAGRWIAFWGTVSTMQYLNPISGAWENLYPVGTTNAMEVFSDGFSFRIMNCSGAAYGAIVTAAGSGYAQATTTVTASAGNSTWTPIIGGAISSSFTVVSGGSGYSMPPVVYIGAPAYGIQATAYATLSAGAVSSVTLGAAGAGYTAAPNVVVLPAPTDPNTNIVNAVVTCALAGAGTLTGVILNNFGEAESSAPTLTVSGAGSSATATTDPATFVAEANDTILLQPAP